MAGTRAPFQVPGNLNLNWPGVGGQALPHPARYPLIIRRYPPQLLGCLGSVLAPNAELLAPHYPSSSLFSLKQLSTKRNPLKEKNEASACAGAVLLQLLRRTSDLDVQ
jgi:hypothetical protein